MGRVFMFSVILFLLIAQSSLTDIPRTVSYQGLLTDASGKPVADGNYSLTFRLYSTDIGGAALWTETHPSVAVIKGIFNVILGSGGSPLNLPFDQQYWLGTQVGAGTELTPRVKLTSTPYSLNAQSVSDGAVTTSKLADNAVTGAKIASSQVVKGINGLKDNVILAPGANVTITPSGQTLTIAATGTALPDGSVTTAKIADGAVTQVKIASGVTLPPSGPAGGDLAGTYPNPTIATGAVNTAKLADNAVTAAKIQPDVVSSVDGVSNDGGNIDLVPGSNITITPDDSANTITISSTGGGGNSWNLTGNSGTIPGTNFLGTTDNNALILKTNNSQTLWLEPNATCPNIIGGNFLNSRTPGVFGATISGGGGNLTYLNNVTDNYGTIGGGAGNQAGDNAGTANDSHFATVGGGYNNLATGGASTVGGGDSNQATGRYSTAPGGLYNEANGNYSFALDIEQELTIRVPLSGLTIGKATNIANPSVKTMSAFGPGEGHILRTGMDFG